MPVTAESYRKQKALSAARESRMSLLGREIGDIPAVQDHKQKSKALKSFRAFCESYFPERFYLPWSPDHLKVIAKVEEAVDVGGLFAVAMPRGDGKTSTCECAVLWAILKGRHRSVLFVGQTESKSTESLDHIKAELSQNEVLAGDFPEILFPIHALEGETRRCMGQIHHGKPTRIRWTEDEVWLPQIPGSPAASSIIRVAGITGAIRGPVHRAPGGRMIRPSLVIVDDPQTDESARSPSQCYEREQIIMSAILNLAGPDQRISVLMPCTVICVDDLAERFLDPKRYPEWRGEKMKLVHKFPTNMKKWDEYAEIRNKSLEEGRDGREATEFYRKNRAAMDEGAEMAWPQRFEPGELSAVQYAMNKRMRGRSFFAEFQQEPLAKDVADTGALSPEEICKKLSGLPRGMAPLACEFLTGFIDVHQDVLFWCLVAWERNFGGSVIDYGVYPEQATAHFRMREAKRTMGAMHKGAGVDGAIYAGMKTVAAMLFAKEIVREGGAVMRLDRCHVDASWGEKTDLVYKFTRQSTHAAMLHPSHGRFVGASSTPMDEYHQGPGDRVGLNWRIPGDAGRQGKRRVLFDANWWKSFVHARLTVPMGDTGCLTLFGKDSRDHRLFADHLCGERGIPTTARGRTVCEWKLRMPNMDNHWLDCLVGCAVAASIQGAALMGVPSGQIRKRVKMSEIQRQKRR